MSAFDFRTFRLYKSGFHYHTIHWGWWTAVMDNNPRIARPIFNPEADMPWDIPL